MFLVTTADHRTWDTTKPILFLGHWCKTLANAESWEHLDYRVAAHRWHNPAHFCDDFCRIRQTYEKFLAVLSAELNRIHSVDRSLRYWRIVVGPWLRYFAEIVFERHITLADAIEQYPVTETRVLDQPWAAQVPAHFDDFQRQLFGDQWNHFLYSQLVRHHSHVTCQQVAISGSHSGTIDAEPASPQSGHGATLRAQSKKLLGRMAGRLNRVFLYQSGIDGADLAKLHVRLRQVPTMESDRASPAVAPANESLRDQFRFDDCANPYEERLAGLIAKQIPRAYLESYASTRRQAMDRFPRDTEVILTAYAYANDDLFKLWAAEQVERGTRLLVTQHGGQFGTRLLEQTEEHQLQIADCFFTWGWQPTTADKAKAMPAPKLVKARATLRPRNDGQLAWIQLSVPRYSYRLSSAVLPIHMSEYLEDQVEFFRSLRPSVVARLSLRPYPHDHGWGIARFFRENGMADVIDPSGSDFLTSLGHSRLCLVSYNSTTFLETFAADFPTLMFWRPEHWQVRAQARPYFDALRDAGVLHDSPRSAARLLNEVFADVSAWWTSRRVQTAVEGFRGIYCRLGEDWLLEWANELKQW